MGLSLLPSNSLVCGTLFLFLIKLCYSMPPQLSQNISEFIPCPDYGPIEFATIKSIDVDSIRLHAIHIECNVGYELVGRHKLLCNDGKWEPYPRPQCIAKCDLPPNIQNGKLSIEREGENDRSGHFTKGTLAIYSCIAGYQLSPPDSQYRVCERGIWTGAPASCVPIEQITACKQPKDIAYGYYVPEKNGVVDGFGIGQRLHYSCNSGYVLDGSPVQQCLEDGTWSPRIPPNCIAAVADSCAVQLSVQAEHSFCGSGNTEHPVACDSAFHGACGARLLIRLSVALSLSLLLTRFLVFIVLRR